MPSLLTSSVALGQQFRKMLPTLWMKAGAIDLCPTLAEGEIPTMLVLPDNGFAVLTEESAFERFAAEVNARPEIKTVYLIMDYEAGYRVMARNLRACFTSHRARHFGGIFRRSALLNLDIHKVCLRFCALTGEKSARKSAHAEILNRLSRLPIPSSLNNFRINTGRDTR